jgi:hypothetical protein
MPDQPVPAPVPKPAPKPAPKPPASELKEYSLTEELWREYDFSFNGATRTYRIDNPVKLFLRKTGNDSGTTHRVLDSEGIVHCVPAPGVWGCVLRWQNKDPNKPVTF